MRVETESGAVYEFRPGQVRRVNDSDVKRGDGVWLTLHAMYPVTPVVGMAMVIVVDSLAGYGPDDEGFEAGEDAEVTTRTTTRVVSVEA